MNNQILKKREEVIAAPQRFFNDEDPSASDDPSNFPVFRQFSDSTSERIRKFRPINALEVNLVRVVLDPAYVTEFHKTLLDSTIYVIGESEAFLPGSHTPAPNAAIEIRTLTSGEIPIFTSPNRIHDAENVKEPVNYIEMSMQEFLSSVRDASPIVMNPFSKFSKDLTPDEIERLRQDMSVRSEEIKLDEATEVFLGSPSRNVADIVKVLYEYFEDQPIISAAYIGQIFDSTSGLPPHLIVGLEMIPSEITRDVIDYAATIATEYLESNEAIDFIIMEHDNEVCDYLYTTEPFYERV